MGSDVFIHMTRVKGLAQKLFELEVGYTPNPYNPHEARPELDNLWPSEKDRYERMAEMLLLQD